MRFDKHELGEGLKIPAAAMTISGFDAEESAEYFTLQNAVAVLKKRMTALELIRAAWSLQQLSAELCTHLAMLCCHCDGCKDCGGDGEHCPAYSPMSFAADVLMPDELRELAGIPEAAPLHIELLDDGEIVIGVNHEGPGLWDVPAPMMQGFLAAGICPAGLEEMLETGEIVYGE